VSAIATGAASAASLTGPRHPLPGVRYRDPVTVQQFLASGAWRASTMGAALTEAARVAGDHLALVAGDDRLTWADLDRRSDDLAVGLLSLGLAPGDRIVFQMGTGTAIVLAFHACWKAGVIPVCAVPAYRAYEIGALVECSGAVAQLVEPGSAGSFDLIGFAAELRAAHPGLRYLLVAGTEAPDDASTVAEVEAAGAAAEPGRARALLDSVAPSPEDVFAFQLSGGSTGVPKIIPRFHGEYLAYAAAWADSVRLTADDVLLWPLSLAHNAGMIYMLIPTLVRRSRLVLLSRFEVESFLTAVETEGVTIGCALGPMGPRLLQAGLQGRDLSSLRYCISMNQSETIERHLGVPCSNFFGITEGLLLGSAPEDAEAPRHFTNGIPVSRFDEVKVLAVGGDAEVPHGEIGELCFRGPSTLTAYVGSDEATRVAFTADGFFRTGDLARAVEHQGRTFYVFEGRNRDNIDRGGEKFGVVEIEELMACHPAITEARVVSMPDPELFERVCAFVTLTPGAGAPTVEEVGAFLLAQGLAKFKLPERIEVISEFPTTGVGKLDRGALRRLAAAIVEGEA
jgi:non-ribosomal peptide synthetase component E (peptide arylation enzyme)